MKAAPIKRIAAMLAVAACGMTVSLPAHAATTVNPLRPVNAANVQADPSHGFGILVAGNAALTGGESETSIAVGGTLTFGGYQVSAKDTGSARYFAHGDAAATSLVASSVDFTKSTGLLQVTQNSFAKFGGSLSVRPNGGVTSLTSQGGAGIAINTAQSANSISEPADFNLPALFTAYRAMSTQLATLSNTVTIQDQNGQNTWNGTDSNVTIALRSGQNVLNVTAAQLAKIQAVNPRGVTLGANAWLIINVTDQGNIDVRGATNAFQNSPAHVLWNFTTAGTINLDSGRQFSGSLYAPNANLVDNDGQNLEGDIAAKSFVQCGAEIHNFHFAHAVTVSAVAHPADGETTPALIPAAPTGKAATTPKSSHAKTSATPPTTATTSPTTPITVSATGKSSSLAFTGVDVALLAGVAVALLGTGTALVLRARRRNT